LNAGQPAVEIGRLNVADRGLFQREIHAKLRWLMSAMNSAP
jgi:hypothetical protein